MNKKIFSVTGFPLVNINVQILAIATWVYTFTRSFSRLVTSMTEC